MLALTSMFGLGAFALVTGALVATTSATALRRVIGSATAFLGAVLAAAALGAPESSLIAGVACAFAYVVAGAAVTVRLQEAYGSVDLSAVNAADAADEKDRQAP